MYGLVHKAIRDMALMDLSDEEWGGIVDSVGLTDVDFISGQPCPDEKTMALIARLAERSCTTPERIWEQLGRCWMKLPSLAMFKEIVRMTGGDLESFLRNVDRMHASMAAVGKGPAGPRIDVRKADDTSLTVRYRSDRQGLEPFALGLLQGLLAYFGERGTVHRSAIGDGVEYTILRNPAAMQRPLTASVHDISAARG